MYFRKGQCEPLGLYKGSWVAEVFGVDERNVKAARSELEAKGVLVREQTPQLVMNRHGLAVRINLDWPGASLESPPRTVLSTTQSPRPRETGISSSRRSENQKLGAPSPSGVRRRTGREPSLSRVTEADLRDPGRVMLLFEQAHRERLIGRSESDRLQFAAAAQRALRLGTRNRPGLFVAMVRRGLWHDLTFRDEDQARHRLAQVPPRATKAAEMSRSVPCPESREEARRLVARSLGL